MNERIVSLLGGLVALCLVFLLLGPRGYREPAGISYPTTEDRGPHGLLGLSRWLSRADIPAESLRFRYDYLLRSRELARSGNLLVLSLPQRFKARDLERERLVEWVTRGNSVLILAAGMDAPAWSIPAIFRSPQLQKRLHRFRTFPIVSDLGFRLNIDRRQKTERAESEGVIAKNSKPAGGSDLDEPLHDERTLLPHGSHAVLHNVAGVAARPLVGTPSWRLRAAGGHRASLVLLHDDASGSPTFWQARVGEGMAWISPYADLFGNAMLGEEDNARFLANIVTHSLGPDGRVLFDDMHQGLSNLYDPQAFFKDPRLHHTVWFIIAFWLLYIVGRSNRLAPLRPAPKQIKAVDFVRAVGGLFARRVSANLVGARLLSNFFNEVRERHHLPTNGRPVWEVLAASPRINPEQLEDLRRRHQQLGATRRPDLINLTNLIREIRSTVS